MTVANSKSIERISKSLLLKVCKAIDGGRVGWQTIVDHIFLKKIYGVAEAQAHES